MTEKVGLVHIKRNLPFRPFATADNHAPLSILVAAKVWRLSATYRQTMLHTLLGSRA